jgi:hypothetical protein
MFAALLEALSCLLRCLRRCRVCCVASFRLLQLLVMPRQLQLFDVRCPWAALGIVGWSSWTIILNSCPPCHSSRPHSRQRHRRLKTWLVHVCHAFATGGIYPSNVCTFAQRTGAAAKESTQRDRPGGLRSTLAAAPILFAHAV